MYKQLILILLLFISVYSNADEKSTEVYDLSPMALDILANWGEMQNFPHKKHFAWQHEGYDMSNLNPAMMEKRYSKVDEDDLKIKLRDVFKSLKVEEKQAAFGVKKLKDGSYKLELTADKSVHSFFHWINSYLENIADNPFMTSGIETPVVSAKFTVISMPVEIALEKGFGGFSLKESPLSFKVQNTEFGQSLKKLTANKDVSLVGEYLCQSVSGKTMVLRDVEAHFYPEEYDFFGKTLPTRIFDEKTQKWKPSTELVEIHGIQPLYGEARDVGNVIEITPQVEPDMKTVSLDIKLLLMKHLGWTEYNQVDDVRMPALQVMTTETRLQSTIGETRAVALQYYSERLKNFKHAVRKEDQSNKLIDKCLVVFVSLEDNKKADNSELKSTSNGWSYYMTPLGSEVKAALQKIAGDKKVKAELKNLLEDMGLKFPEGSFFHYNHDYSVISTFNKTSEVKKLISFLPKNNSEQENDQPQRYQASNLITANMMVELSGDHAAKLGITEKTNVISLRSIRKMFDPAGGHKATVKSYNAVITQNGNTAINRDVIEFYMPESFEFQKAGDKTLALPLFGDPHDVGFVLEVTSQVDPNNRDFETDFGTYLRDILGWTKRKTDGIKLPVFKEGSLDTRIKGAMRKPSVLSVERKDGKVIINLLINHHDYL